MRRRTNVTGFDLGLVNHSTGIQKGVQWGGVNLTDGGVTGWQSGFVNISKDVQLACKPVR